MQRITDDVRDEAIRLRVHGRMTVRAIAKCLGIGRQSAFRICRPHPIPRGNLVLEGMRSPWSGAENDALRALWPLADEEKIAAAIPARSMLAIARHAAALGITRDQPKYRERIGHIDPIMITIRKVREAKGLRLIDVAEATGYSHVNLSRWESGLVSPRLVVVRNICQFLGIDLSARGN
jgi:DNA-binding XRE family transcriptional regulator